MRNYGSGNRGGGAVQSLLRGMEILELLARSEWGLSLQDVCEQTGLKPTTAHNLLRTLSMRGFVARDARPVRYRIGSALPELVHLRSRRQFLRRAAEQLRQLARRHLGGTFTLSEIAERQVVVALRLSADRPDRVSEPRGQVLSPYTTACGLAYQAFAAPSAREEYRQAHPFWEHVGRLWESPEMLESFLLQARRNGYVSVSFRGEHVFKASAPVYGDGGELVALLGGSRPAKGMARAEHESYVQDLRSAARRLSSDEPGEP